MSVLKVSADFLTSRKWVKLLAICFDTYRKITILWLILGYEKILQATSF